MRRIKVKRYLANVILISLSILILAKINYGVSGEKSECVITGKIQTNDVLNKNSDGLPYGGTTLVFKSKSISKVTKSDLAGNYSITLPKGIYNVSVKTLYNTIFYRRAVFNCQGNIVINIYPLIQQVSSGIKSTGPLDHQIETLSKGWTGNSKLNIVIAYMTKNKEKNLTSYQRNVYLTFDKYCIFASQVVKDEKKKTLTAENFAWIEDGIERKKVEKVTLRFSKDGLKIDF